MNSNATAILHDAATVQSDDDALCDEVFGRIMGPPSKPIAMDEWNMFAISSQQMVSNTSGVFGAIVVGEALSNKYGMAATGDMLNGWATAATTMGCSAPGIKLNVTDDPRPSFYYTCTSCRR